MPIATSVSLSLHTVQLRHITFLPYFLCGSITVWDRECASLLLVPGLCRSGESASESA